MTRKPSALDLVADNWLKRMAELSPIFATDIGQPGGEDKLDDESPAGHELYYTEAKRALAEVNAAPIADEVDRITADAMRRSLELDIELHDAKVHHRNLNVIASPVQGIREVFDISPTDTEQDWSNIAKRMSAVPEAIAGYIETLRLGIRSGDTPARRQVERCIEQSLDNVKAGGFFETFAAGAKPESGELPATLKGVLEASAKDAIAGYESLIDFLMHELLPNANTEDAIGREKYELFSRRFVGAKINLDETYEWGIEELSRVVAEQKEVANQIKPGSTIEEAKAFLGNDPTRKLHGTKALQEWMQKLSDAAIEKLSGTHFDIAEPLKKLECMIAPSQTGGIYYTGPTDDFSRPGRMWWSVPAGVEEFDTWRETTTVYHEGIPGHHLQVGQQVYNRDELNSWRRLASWSSGHGEGWALYAERLMADLGFLDDPADRLGMLDGQRMRAARVVLDIGSHLKKPRLDGTGHWDFDYALDFMTKNAGESPAFVNFEVHRYFGWPGQAPSYKIGQRIWENIRDEYQAKQGQAFDIKEFHRKALNLGGLGLDTLRLAMA